MIMAKFILMRNASFALPGLGETTGRVKSFLPRFFKKAGTSREKAGKGPPHSRNDAQQPLDQPACLILL
jgi:hypothetical protein